MSVDTPDTAVPPNPGLLTRLRVVAGRGRGDAAGMLVSQVAAVILGFAANVVLARMAGVADYGTYAYAVGWAALLGVPAVLGLDRVLVRELATYARERDYALMRGLLRRANQVAGLAALVFGLVALGIAMAVSPSEARLPVLIALAVVVPASAFARVRQAALQGLRKATLGYAAQSIVRPVAFLALLGGIWLLAGVDDLSAAEAVALQAVAAVVALSAGAAALRKVLPREVRTTAPRFEGRQWAASLPILAIIAGLNMLNHQAGILMLGALDHAADAGRFAAATRGTAAIAFGLTAVNAVLAPRIAAAWADDDRRSIDDLLAKGARGAFLVALPLGAALIAFAPTFLSIFGSEFEAGGTTLVILAAGQMFNVAMGSLGMVLVMTRHERAACAATAAGTVLNFGLAAALIPGMGGDGAAVAMTASIATINVLFAVVAVRRLGIRPLPFLHRSS